MSKPADPKPTFGGALLFPTEFLAAEDLGGKDVTVTIESIQKESLRTTDGKEDKYTIRFEKAKKRLVLNKTNAVAIAIATGQREAKKWPGHRVTLYATTCAAFGQEVPCIRVRHQRPAESQPVPPASNMDAEPDAAEFEEANPPGTLFPTGPTAESEGA